MHLSPLDLLKWIHFVCLGTALGGAVVSLLLSGFEQEREDLKGLAATVWKQAVGLLGVILYTVTRGF